MEIALRKSMSKRTIVEVVAAFIGQNIPIIGSALRELIRSLVPTKPVEKSEALKEIYKIINSNKHKKIDVITISACNYDAFLKVDKIAPNYECEIQDKIFSDRCAGGSGANTIAGLAKLGKKTAIVGCVNSDSAGREIIQSFENLLVDTQLLIQLDEPAYPPTGRAIVLVENSGKRQILVSPGVNSHLDKILREKGLLNVLIDKVKSSRIVHLSSFAGKDEMELQLRVLQNIIGSNTLVSLTPGALYVEKGLEQLTPILGATNILFLYVEQLEQLLEQSQLQKFRRNLTIEQKAELFFRWKISKRMYHPMLLVVKDNLRIKSHNICDNYISVASSAGKSKGFFQHSNAAFKIEDCHSRIVLDSTGAGDAVAAGFLAGILEEESIEKCADFGFVIATQVSRMLGARAGLLDRETLNQEVKRLVN
ncbi:hypothetical protein B7486_44745 [cyanobacterium TDX16]|nr:hypothetical protein B7486_44745 [cyanobacterium TDX16]